MDDNVCRKTLYRNSLNIMIYSALRYRPFAYDSKNRRYNESDVFAQTRCRSVLLHAMAFVTANGNDCRIRIGIDENI